MVVITTLFNNYNTKFLNYPQRTKYLCIQKHLIAQSLKGTLCLSRNTMNFFFIQCVCVKRNNSEGLMIGGFSTHMLVMILASFLLLQQTFGKMIFQNKHIN